MDTYKRYSRKESHRNESFPWNVSRHSEDRTTRDYFTKTDPFRERHDVAKALSAKSRDDVNDYRHSNSTVTMLHVGRYPVGRDISPLGHSRRNPYLPQQYPTKGGSPNKKNSNSHLSAMRSYMESCSFRDQEVPIEGIQRHFDGGSPIKSQAQYITNFPSQGDKWPAVKESFEDRGTWRSFGGSKEYVTRNILCLAGQDLRSNSFRDHYSHQNRQVEGESRSTSIKDKIDQNLAHKSLNMRLPEVSNCNTYKNSSFFEKLCSVKSTSQMEDLEYRKQHEFPQFEKSHEILASSRSCDVYSNESSGKSLVDDVSYERDEIQPIFGPPRNEDDSFRKLLSKIECSLDEPSSKEMRKTSAGNELIRKQFSEATAELLRQQLSEAGEQPLSELQNSSGSSSISGFKFNNRVSKETPHPSQYNIVSKKRSRSARKKLNKQLSLLSNETKSTVMSNKTKSIDLACVPISRNAIINKANKTPHLDRKENQNFSYLVGTSLSSGCEDETAQSWKAAQRAILGCAQVGIHHSNNVNDSCKVDENDVSKKLFGDAKWKLRKQLESLSANKIKTTDLACVPVSANEIVSKINETHHLDREKNQNSLHLVGPSHSAGSEDETAQMSTLKYTQPATPYSNNINDSPKFVNNDVSKRLSGAARRKRRKQLESISSNKTAIIDLACVPVSGNGTVSKIDKKRTAEVICEGQNIDNNYEMLENIKKARPDNIQFNIEKQKVLIPKAISRAAQKRLRRKLKRLELVNNTSFKISAENANMQINTPLNHSKSPEDHEKISIIPENYPNVLINVTDAEFIKNAILFQCDVLRRHKLVPTFYRFSRNGGALLVFCDTPTKEWLRQVLPECSPPMGPRLCIASSEVLLRDIRTRVWFPGPAEDPQDLLHRLMMQNDGIRTDTWRVVSCKVLEKGQNLIILMNEISWNEIVERRQLLSFDFTTIRFELVRGQKGKPNTKHDNANVHLVGNKKKKNKKKKLSMQSDSASGITFKEQRDVEKSVEQFTQKVVQPVEQKAKKKFTSSPVVQKKTNKESTQKEVEQEQIARENSTLSLFVQEETNDQSSQKDVKEQHKGGENSTLSLLAQEENNDQSSQKEVEEQKATENSTFPLLVQEKTNGQSTQKEVRQEQKAGENSTLSLLVQEKINEQSTQKLVESEKQKAVGNPILVCEETFTEDQAEDEWGNALLTWDDIPEDGETRTGENSVSPIHSLDWSFDEEEVGGSTASSTLAQGETTKLA